MQNANLHFCEGKMHFFFAIIRAGGEAKYNKHKEETGRRAQKAFLAW